VNAHCDVCGCTYDLSYATCPRCLRRRGYGVLAQCKSENCRDSSGVGNEEELDVDVCVLPAAAKPPVELQAAQLKHLSERQLRERMGTWKLMVICLLTGTVLLLFVLLLSPIIKLPEWLIKVMEHVLALVVPLVLFGLLRSGRLRWLLRDRP
jgi:hypothetical protein